MKCRLKDYRSKGEIHSWSLYFFCHRQLMKPVFLSRTLHDQHAASFQGWCLFGVWFFYV